MKIAIIIFLFPWLSYAEFHGEIGFGVNSGSNSYVERGSGFNVNHDEAFLSFGVSLMSRLGIKLTNVSIAAVGFLEWEGALLKYQQSNQSILGSGTYSTTNRKIAYGPSVVFFIPSIGYSVIGEYYPYVNNTIQWTEIKSMNPFRSNDYFTGWGFGIGIGKMISKIHLQAMYRSLYYTKANLNGVETSISGSRFERANWGGAFIGGAYLF